MCLFQIKDHEEQNQSKVNDLWPTQDNIASGDMSYSYDTFSERFSGENQLKPQDKYPACPIYTFYKYMN